MILQNLIHCGRVLKPHGLKGELCTLWFADSPLLLTGLPRLHLKVAGLAPKAFNIVSWRRHQKKFLVILEGITGRDQAEKWQGAEIHVSSRYIPGPDTDETYLFEILESRIFLTGNIYLGRLKQVFEHKGSEVWQIMTADNQEVLFPVNEQFVININTRDRKIVINPPEGLLEIYGINIAELENS